MPTIASTNSDAEMEKNGTLASPATARASSVLPVPGRAREQHAARDPAAELAVAVRVLEEVDDLGQLGLGLVDAGHVVERDRASRRPRRAARASARTRRARPSARRRRGARATRTAPTSRITGPKPRIRLSRNPRPSLIGLAADLDVVVLQRLRAARRCSANVGISVVEVLGRLASLASAGSLTAFLNSPVDRLALRGDLR